MENEAHMDLFFFKEKKIKKKKLKPLLPIVSGKTKQGIEG